MARLILMVFCMMNAASPAFSRYHTPEELIQKLKELSLVQPDAHYHSIGLSRERRELGVLRVGNPRAPGIYLNGGHHGNEPISSEVILGLAEYAVTTQNPKFADFLQKYCLYFQPAINPDGLAHQTRTDTAGVDLNRDYPSPGDTSKDVFTTPETQAVSRFLRRNRVHGSLAFHSGFEGVLWPWGHTRRQNPHHRFFKKLASSVAEAMGIASHRQSFFDYPTYGEFIDYAYRYHKMAALTVEISGDHQPHPSKVQYYKKRALKGFLAFLQGLMNHRKRPKQYDLPLAASTLTGVQYFQGH